MRIGIDRALGKPELGGIMGSNCDDLADGRSIIDGLCTKKNSSNDAPLTLFIQRLLTQSRKGQSSVRPKERSKTDPMPLAIAYCIINSSQSPSLL